MSKNYFTPLLLATAMLSGCDNSGVSSDSESVSGGSEGVPSTAIHYEATKESLDQHQLPQWWADAKFGIFIHWGLYSVPAYAPTGYPGIPPGIAAPPGCSPYAEWYWFVQQAPICLTWSKHLQNQGAGFVYDDFIPQWKADSFDPDAWIKLFEQAGAKYFVLTTKHHDGFALWPTRTTQRNAMDMGPKRDLVGELFAAAHRADDRVKPGLYFSIPEWYNPAPKPLDAYLPTDLSVDSALATFGTIFGPLSIYGPRNAYTQLPVPYTGQGTVRDYASDIVRPQFEELINDYKPSIIWCDIGGRESYFKSNQSIANFYNNAKTTHPEGVVVNDRCGEKSKTHLDFNTVEFGAGSPIPPFEATRGIGESFGFNMEEEKSNHYLSASELIHTLVSTVAQGGNLLLDIGPKADGSIPDSMTTRLQAIGAWLGINGKSIYGSTQWTQSSDGGSNYFTVGKDGALYIIATEWPSAQTLTVNASVPLTASSKIVLLGSDGTPLQYKQNGSQLVITLPSGGAQMAATKSQSAFVFRVSPVAL
ncbi:alpha-L-fucosidase [Paraperlucidibaca wandonensis]|uniref:alpha-L-fucosidase n=1 Tax=Paraperlucidibaca wandonensis TaxID=1268273 RepID=A0ABW3HC84_9GAMM